jgi:hypothetical protein
MINDFQRKNKISSLYLIHNSRYSLIPIGLPLLSYPIDHVIKVRVGQREIISFEFITVNIGKPENLKSPLPTYLLFLT